MTLSTKETLIKRYHTLASKLSMGSEERTAFLSSWNVASSKEMTRTQLTEACRKLADYHFTKSDDKWRKRVIAAIGGYMKLTGRKDQGIEYIKNIACRASSYSNFNKIPIDKLRSLYNSFTHQSKVFTQTGNIVNDELDHLQFNN